MKVLRLATVAALAALALSAAPVDAKKNKNKAKECHADPDDAASTTPVATPLAPGKTTTAAPVSTTAPAKTTTTVPSTKAPESTKTPAPSKTKAPKASSGLKVKLYKKKNLTGKKIVVKTENDVCYSVTTCFDDLASSIAWSKIPTEAASIEFFKGAACADTSVVISNLGAVGGNGSVASLDDLHFSDAVSSFIVRSRTGQNVIKSQADACEGQEDDTSGKSDTDDKADEDVNEEDVSDEDDVDDVAGEASETPSTTKPPKSTGLKVKLFKKADLDGKKLTIKTQNDVCYSVDACFDDLTSSIAWSKVPVGATSIELFESTACADASVVISDLGAVGASGNVTSLKDLKFSNKLSSFVVRSASGNGVIQSQESGCTDETDEDGVDGEVASDASTSVAPATTTPAPVATTQTPVPSPSVPVSTTQAPVATTVAPVATTSAPVATTLAPVATTSAPAATTLAPVVTTSAPVTTTQAPVVTTPAPVATTPVPVVTTEILAATTSTPVATSPSPVATTATPVATETVAPTKTKGLKVKLYNKVDLNGDKLVVSTQNDVCYNVDACFSDKTTSLEWTKVTSDAKAIELFESAGCTGTSVSLTALGEVGGGSSVATLKDYKFNNKVSSFVVRSKSGGNAIVREEDGCVAKADSA